MTLLSRKADYALLIVSFLQANPEGGTARAIADRFGLSRSFVANILKELCQKGYLASHRGVKGGYSLQRPLAEVSLAELLESIEEGFRLTRCSEPGVSQDPCSLESTCPVKAPLADVHRRIGAVLRGVTLADLVTPTSPTGSVGLPQLIVQEPTCCAAPERCHLHTTV